jgi:hypothetical protein
MSSSSSEGDDAALCAAWAQLRDRLRHKQLLGGDGASVSLRRPGTADMWFGLAAEASPRRLPLASSPRGEGDAARHAALYLARPGAGAMASGGGVFGAALADFGGTMPQVFDEQARHLGPMGARHGNVLLEQGRVVCLGSTPTRLALNAELFEKCAKAYVLAAATGGAVRPLPWPVRFIANRRLRRDARRAAERFAQGLLPEESKGY